MKVFIHPRYENQLSLRLATTEVQDSCFLWQLRNSQRVRSMSVNRHIIPYEEHEQWMTGMVQKPREPLFIVHAQLYSDLRVGMGRLALVEGGNSFHEAVALSYAISAEVTGNGYGTALIQMLCIQAQTLGYQAVVAVVHEDNAASIHILHKNGFTYHKEHSMGISPFLQYDMIL